MAVYEDVLMNIKAKNWMKRNLFSLITILLSIGILSSFLMQESYEGTVGKIIANLQWIWLFWIAVDVILGLLLESYVIHLLCLHFDKKWSFGKSFYIGMLGIFYSNLTPFSMGEPMEIYQMTKLGMKTGIASSVIAVKSLIHHGVTFFYALLLVAFKLQYFQTEVNNFSFIAVFGLITNSIFIFLVMAFMINSKITIGLLKGIAFILNKIGLKKLALKLYRKIYRQLMVFHASSQKIGKAPLMYSVAIILTLVQITLASLVSYLVYRSFSFHGESMVTMVAADTFVTMAASFVPLPGSSGGAEGGFLLFFNKFFGDTIVPALTLWRFATYYIEIPICGAVTYWGNKKYIANRQESANIQI